MRCFIGLVPGGTIKQEILGLESQINEIYSCSTNIDPHITLKLLGELGPYRLEKVMSILSNMKPDAFEVSFDGFGFFESDGSKDSSSAIYLKVTSPGVRQLHNQLVDRLKPYDSEGYFWEKENYTPHLSLGIDGLTIESLNKARKDLRESHFFKNYIAEDMVLLTKPEGGVYSEHSRYKLWIE